MSNRFAEYLLEKRLLPQERVAQALARQEKVQGTFDTALLEEETLPESAVLDLLGHLSELKAMDLSDVEPSSSAASLLPSRLAERMVMVPLAKIDNVLHLACTWPTGQQHLKKLEELLKTPVRAWVACECRIRDWMTKLYQVPLPERYALLLSRLEEKRKGQPSDVEIGGELRIFENTGFFEAPSTATELQAQTLEEAVQALTHASHDRTQLLNLTLGYAQKTFGYVSFFAVREGVATFWDQRSTPPLPPMEKPLRIPLDTASVFRTVCRSRGSYIGPVPADEWTMSFLEAFGRKPRLVFLFPIEVRGKVVGILYGDNGSQPIRQRRFSDLLLFCQELPTAFAQVIRLRKGTTPTGIHPVMAFSRSEIQERVGPSSLQPTVADASTWVKVLLGPDAARRAEALVQLARTPKASAERLVAEFPGPTAWPKMTVTELPEVKDLGPIPSALVQIGEASVLSPLLSASDAEARYVALLTSAHLPSNALLPSVMKALFDLDPEVASAARLAARAHRALPEFAAYLPKLREALFSAVPLRCTLAIKALGALRDVESVEPLIPLLNHESTMVSQAALEAMKDITLASLGRNVDAWTQWHETHQKEAREHWLLAGLRHPELDIRQRAIDELSHALKADLGFVADAPENQRAEAIVRWEDALTQKALAL